MKKEEIRELLSLIKGIYGHRFFVEDSTVSAWETYLSPFPARIVKKAMDEWIENRQPEKESVPPSAADLMHLADSIWSRQESTAPAITDQRKCSCSAGWVYFQDGDGYNVAAKCGLCRIIGVRTDRNEKPINILYVHPETLEVM